ncbi:MAG TPA: cysteine--tRNA ligase [Saprospiraceae bacterium]|nr:cysteine--tRNA ligase [Saprospiraceae bacterium]
MALKLYNSLERKKVTFEPIHKGQVGMYVCGPTVYSDVHLGNIRTFVSFDVIYRYLMHLGYKVRYVRNITDVGHLEGDADSNAEDKISQRARLEQLEPMEIVQHYMNGFHNMMHRFNALDPDIEPRATGHIIEQIEMVQDILDNGFAYIENGSVYFDTVKFQKEKKVYGQLSGRVIDELMTETRDDLKNQSEKRHPSDFAIWIKASPTHLMRWKSPWSIGFPGWHLECSVMSTKYLGEYFDIHGGGNDLKFPHHENEIAQNIGSCGVAPAKYWLHTNMLLMHGKKMSKSDGNSITPYELFTGDSPHVSKGYSPMVLRFFMLQAHYRSTLDISDEALQAAEKGYKKLMEANKVLQGLSFDTYASAKTETDEAILKLMQETTDGMDDDFNTAIAIGKLHELAGYINKLANKQLASSQISESTLQNLKTFYQSFIQDVFGLRNESEQNAEDDKTLDGLMQLMITMRQKARADKDWATSDLIRDALAELKIQVKDGKDGSTWSKV